MSKKRWVYLVMGIILIADQVLKIFIKTSFTLGESVHVFDWFQIVFVENPGMAFGITLGSKLFLTLFRIVVIAFAIYYLYLLIRDKYKTSYIVCVALIVAGAIGNASSIHCFTVSYSAKAHRFKSLNCFPKQEAMHRF